MFLIIGVKLLQLEIAFFVLGLKNMFFVDEPTFSVDEIMFYPYKQVCLP